MRRRILCYNQSENGGPVEPSKAQVCDVVFANKNDGNLVIVHGGESSWKSYPSSEWEPIGVVVIPAEHGVLKDGTGTVNLCGVMSLVTMNCDTPEIGGTSEQNIYWGGDSDDITSKSDGLGRFDSYNSNGLINYNVVVVVNKSNPTVPSGTNNFVYMPRQTSVGGTPEWDSSSAIGAPSPYAGDDMKSGNLNPAYIATDSPSSSGNCLSDFRGIVNTKIITELATGQNDWKTADSIVNNSGSTYYPAACCCARFKTTGTKSFKDCTNDELKDGTGFWYLPSMGELGYIPPRVADINDIINKLKTVYGNCVQINRESAYWSSSEFARYGALTIDLNGRIIFYNKYESKYNNHVRAFMRL